MIGFPPPTRSRSMNFPYLFSSIVVGGVTLKNRIFSTGHQTMMAREGLATDALVAYHKARARGGAGLIIMESSRPHASTVTSGYALDASRDVCIAAFAKVAEAVQRHDCRLFGQLSHAGRSMSGSADGALPVAYSASDTPEERFHTRPRKMPQSMIKDVIRAYGEAAVRMQKAGLDGLEILASHGLLPAQFLNPKVNRREDEYGGSGENRMRFLREVISTVRAQVGVDFVLGLRISVDELETDGLEPSQVWDVLRVLDTDGVLDYYNVTAGTMAGPAGSVHVVPPMFVDTGYVAPLAAQVKSIVSKPVFVAGRINQPQIAERVLANGEADVCGMTRAMICDPEMPEKAKAGRLDDIRACIGCNQACIGHMQTGHPISCIQHPETGRELHYGKRQRADNAKKVIVAGGGPGGMKAAAVAAARGHEVVLYERAARLGGQALLAQLLPGRSEFGGIVTNLTRELELAGVSVRTNVEVTRELINAEQPDAVVVATGATAYRPTIEGEEEGHVVDAWQVLRGETNVGARVVVADWRCDWVGLGLAEKLARDGCHVRLAVNGMGAGESLQLYVRNKWIGELHKLGVEIIPYTRLFGVDAETVYLQHTTSGEAVLCGEVDTLVLAQGHESCTALEASLEGFAGDVRFVGDCLAPRTAEEAVLEGLKVGSEI